MKSASKLSQINDLKQSIHNLKMRFPIGIKRIDDESDEKLKRLEKLLAREEKMSTLNSVSLEIMVNGYLTTALWSTVNWDDGPLDETYDVKNISEEFKNQAKIDCEKLWNLIYDFLDSGEIDFSTLGHDFWLTRNRHGAGFWDGDYTQGDTITKLVNENFKENDDDLREAVNN